MNINFFFFNKYLTSDHLHGIKNLLETFKSVSITFFYLILDHLHNVSSPKIRTTVEPLITDHDGTEPLSKRPKGRTLVGAVL